jgi:hypothetical protein
MIAIIVGAAAAAAVVLIVILAASLAPRPIPCTQPSFDTVSNKLCESGGSTIATTITVTGQNFFNLDGKLPTFKLNDVDIGLVSLNDCSGTFAN